MLIRKEIKMKSVDNRHGSEWDGNTYFTSISRTEFPFVHVRMDIHSVWEVDVELTSGI